MANALPSADELRDLLSYDASTGQLIWKYRPRFMFSTERGYKRWNSTFAGRVAFSSVNNCGYHVGSIWGERFYAHRVIWKMVYGVDPDVIDHRNGRGTDNRLSNLRSCKPVYNLRNKKRHPRNTSGVSGVYWDSRSGNWRAQITVDGRRISRSFVRIGEAANWRTQIGRKHGYTERHLA